MRERRRTKTLVRWYPRITPAHAGKTNASSSLSLMRQDHPRACGKDTPASSASSQSRGSPPRMRERLPFWMPKAGPFRIAPAHAGNTLPPASASSSEKDHPRACGKHPSQQSLIQSVRGSPPRLRETLDWIRDFAERNRITPAPAGNTRRKKKEIPIPQDHPRACGKHGATP